MTGDGCFKSRRAWWCLEDCLNNQNGGIVIVLAMMVLLIMTIIGLVSSQSVITENYIIRNQAIHKQNINMVESALMVGLQQFMQIPDDDPENFDINNPADIWLNSIRDDWAANDWYDADNRELILDATNSEPVPDSQIQVIRKEADNIRTSIVGWETVTLAGGGSESLRVSSSRQTSVWRRGRILAEYMSDQTQYGRLRMEIGIKRRIPIN